MCRYFRLTNRSGHVGGQAITISNFPIAAAAAPA